MGVPKRDTPEWFTWLAGAPQMMVEILEGMIADRQYMMRCSATREELSAERDQYIAQRNELLSKAAALSSTQEGT